MPPDPPRIEGPSGLPQMYLPVTLKYPLVQKLLETPDITMLSSNQLSYKALTLGQPHLTKTWTTFFDYRKEDHLGHKTMLMFIALVQHVKFATFLSRCIHQQMHIDSRVLNFSGAIKKKRKEKQQKKAVLLGKLKGAQCSEPVNSRVPSIWFLRKIWDFLVAQEQKFGARGHWALLEPSPATPHGTQMLIQI